jgi:hypothetical protein
MKTLSIAVATLSLIMGCAVEPEGAGAAESATSETAASLEGTLATTWHLITTESCLDIFRRACTSTFPSPQCAVANPASQPCATAGATCYRSLPGGAAYREYSCY